MKNIEGGFTWFAGKEVVELVAEIYVIAGRLERSVPSWGSAVPGGRTLGFAAEDAK